MPFNPLSAETPEGAFQASFSSGTSEAFLPGARPRGANSSPPEPRDEPAPATAAPDMELLLARAREEGGAQERRRLEAEVEQVRAALVLLTRATDEVDQLRSTVLRSTAREVGEIITRLCERVLERSLALHPDALPTLLEAAMGRFPDRQGLRVRVPQGTLELLRARVDPDVAEALVADPTLVDGVVVSSEHGAVESTLEAALDAVEEAVRAWQEAASC